MTIKKKICNSKISTNINNSVKNKYLALKISCNKNIYKKSKCNKFKLKNKIIMKIIT